MEGAKELKHVCKFCSKRFPCGRSLGGHMRSHLINSGEFTREKFSKEKLKSISSSCNGSYELRENPRKTWRVADSGGEDALLSCKDCGKVFLSTKALFGHMKSHSEKERISNSANNSLADHDSWASVMDSQSDNEESETQPDRLRRSSRRKPRYMGTATATTTSSSLSFANNHTSNNASCSVSGIEQEQEDVALSLILLSRDVGQWGGRGGRGNSTLNSVAESSENNSLFLEGRKQLEGNRKNSISKEGDDKKPKMPSTRSCYQSEGAELELSASMNVKNGGKMHKVEIFDDGFCRNEKGDSKLDVGGKNLSSKSMVTQGDFGNFSIVEKRKVDVSYSAESEMEKWGSDPLKFACCKAVDKRTKFECTTCNKVFHSYQALGGHRASHKKIKGCSSSKLETSDNSLEIDVSPADSKIKQGQTTDHTSKKAQKHECPICFKVFSSGQALGGHKRSHLIGEAKTSNHPSVVIRKSRAEIRDFLDLNLPAPAEDEASNAHIGFSKPWWHEPLLGLISN
ncbi:hypothetical protein Ancab_038823 [Ancistrocladus abbreviatus]